MYKRQDEKITTNNPAPRIIPPVVIDTTNSINQTIDRSTPVAIEALTKEEIARIYNNQEIQIDESLLRYEQRESLELTGDADFDIGEFEVPEFTHMTFWEFVKQFFKEIFNKIAS